MHDAKNSKYKQKDKSICLEKVILFAHPLTKNSMKIRYTRWSIIFQYFCKKWIKTWGSIQKKRRKTSWIGISLLLLATIKKWASSSDLAFKHVMWRPKGIKRRDLLWINMRKLFFCQKPSFGKNISLLYRLIA